MITLAFTKSDTLLSKAIRDASKSESSHMIWVLDDRLIFHSNHHGCHPQWINRFLIKNEIVHSIDLDLLSSSEEEALYLEILKFDGKKYDFGALWYQAVSWVMFKLKIMNLKKANKWGSKNRYLCLELARALEIFKIDLPALDYMAPDALYFYLKGALKDKLTSGNG